MRVKGTDSGRVQSHSIGGSQGMRQTGKIARFGKFDANTESVRLGG